MNLHLSKLFHMHVLTLYLTKFFSVKLYFDHTVLEYGLDTHQINPKNDEAIRCYACKVTACLQTKHYQICTHSLAVIDSVCRGAHDSKITFIVRPLYIFGIFVP